MLRLLSNPFAWGLILAAAMFGGAAAWYNWKKQSWIEYGKQQVISQQLYAENTGLREDRREISRLVEVNNAINGHYQETLGKLKAVGDRLSVVDSELQQLTDALPAKLKTASAESVRKYAEATSRDHARLRADAKRFGIEAAESSAAAYALKDSLDACTAGLKPESH